MEPPPKCEEEVKEIMDFVRGKSTSPITRLDSPSIAQVLSELPSSDVIYFGCHGVSDPENP